MINSNYPNHCHKPDQNVQMSKMEDHSKIGPQILAAFAGKFVVTDYLVKKPFGKSQPVR